MLHFLKKFRSVGLEILQSMFFSLRRRPLNQRPCDVNICRYSFIARRSGNDVDDFFARGLRNWLSSRDSRRMVCLPTNFRLFVPRYRPHAFPHREIQKNVIACTDVRMTIDLKTF